MMMCTIFWYNYAKLDLRNNYRSLHPNMLYVFYSIYTNQYILKVGFFWSLFEYFLVNYFENSNIKEEIESEWEKV